MQRTHSLALAGVAFAMLQAGSSPAFAQVSLGSASSFAVLGGSTVTNTGTTKVNGNLGLSPGSAVIGFPPGIVLGTVHVSDAVAVKAQNDATTAFNALAGIAANFDLTGQDLGGLTLVPGVYKFTSSAQLTGALTLDALGNDSSVFVFQIGTAITTASNSSVNLINGASGCNVFWQVGSSATLGTSTSFVGNILASASITLTTTAKLAGRALALNGAVTLDSNDVAIPANCQCVSTTGPGCAGSGGFVPELSLSCPTPGSIAALDITNGLGGATAIVFAGVPSAHPICGCTLAVRPGPMVLFLPLGGSGAGNGSLTYNTVIHGSTSLGTFAVQVFILDAGAPCGFSSSNSILVNVD